MEEEINNDKCSRDQINKEREIWIRILSATSYRNPTKIILNNMGLVISHINMPRPWVVQISFTQWINNTTKNQKLSSCFSAILRVWTMSFYMLARWLYIFTISYGHNHIQERRLFSFFFSYASLFSRKCPYMHPPLSLRTHWPSLVLNQSLNQLLGGGKTTPFKKFCLDHLQFTFQGLGRGVVISPCHIKKKSLNIMKVLTKVK